MSEFESFVTLLGLTAITVLTRSFFMLSERELRLPDWVNRGLRYAPLAALMAVVVPEIVMSHGHLITTFKDARLYAAAVASAYFFWRRGILGTIVSGMAVLIPLKLGLGW
ncbi:MAG TPA: AzlD domain-containing protein [Rhizobacter sp.]|nr:AzlD domain-containing protein [Rhizobacter sp.]